MHFCQLPRSSYSRNLNVTRMYIQKNFADVSRCDSVLQLNVVLKHRSPCFVELDRNGCALCLSWGQLQTGNCTRTEHESSASIQFALCWGLGQASSYESPQEFQARKQPPTILTSTNYPSCALQDNTLACIPRVVECVLRQCSAHPSCSPISARVQIHVCSCSHFMTTTSVLHDLLH